MFLGCLSRSAAWAKLWELRQVYRMNSLCHWEVVRCETLLWFQSRGLRNSHIIVLVICWRVQRCNFVGNWNLRPIACCAYHVEWSISDEFIVLVYCWTMAGHTIAVGYCLFDNSIRGGLPQTILDNTHQCAWWSCSGGGEGGCIFLSTMCCCAEGNLFHQNLSYVNACRSVIGTEVQVSSFCSLLVLA